MTEEKVMQEKWVLSEQKHYDELTFTDNFLFCKIMEKNPGLCRELIEIILGVKIKKIIFTGRETAIGVTPNGKSIRLDVYVADDVGTVYDLEMQITSHKNLPKRMRYYQGMIDLNLLEKGVDYKELGRSFIIFICTFDFFGKGLPIYTFTNRCSECPELELGDDTVKIFVNPNGDMSMLAEDMKALLRYLRGEMTEDNTFIRKVHHEVSTARSCEEWRVEYMTLMMEYRERYNEGFLCGHEEGQKIGREEGQKIGREEGRKEGIRQGIEQGMECGMEQGIRVFVLDKIEENIPKDKVVEKLQKGFQLSREKAQYYYEKVVSEL